MGALQYYSRFIAAFASLAEPLFQLQGSDEFEWTQIQQSSLDNLITAITSKPVLACYKFSKEATLTVDASEFGLGAVLEQCGQPVIFISRRFTRAEKNYSQTQKEALAVIYAVRRLHKYLYGRKFTLVTDHQALQFIFDPSKSLSKCTNSMLAIRTPAR